MKNFEQLDDIFKQALSSREEPGEELNKKIIIRFKETHTMKAIFRKRLVGVIIAAVITIAMSATAFAAWQLLSARQVAEQFGNEQLAEAFEAKDAVEINKTIGSHGYNITLLGITTGKNLSGFEGSALQDINPDRTYAVVSIAKADGGKMPGTSDEAYGQVPFFISPLIKGQKPWQVNIASMNGGYSECVVDGVMYRLIECDGVEMFADRGLYLCVSTTRFFDINAFDYDEKTGEVSPKAEFDGVNVLFDLPLDVKKADHEKAGKYLKQLLGDEASSGSQSDSAKSLADFGSKGGDSQDVELEKELKGGVVVPESVKEVTFDKNGMAYYDYKEYSMSFDVDSFFEKGQNGISKNLFVTEREGKKSVVQFTSDEMGRITGKVILIQKDN